MARMQLLSLVIALATPAAGPAADVRAGSPAGDDRKRGRGQGDLLVRHARERRAAAAKRRM